MKLHFPKDWLRKISKEDLDGDDIPIGRPDAWQGLGPPPYNGTAEERELDAMTYAFPPNKGRFEFILGMVACFGVGSMLLILAITDLVFDSAKEPWMGWITLAMAASLYLVGIFGWISRKRDQDYRKRMVLEHEAYTASQLKDRPTASTMN